MCCGRAVDLLWVCCGVFDMLWMRGGWVVVSPGLGRVVDMSWVGLGCGHVVDALWTCPGCVFDVLWTCCGQIVGGWWGLVHVDNMSWVGCERVMSWVGCGSRVCSGSVVGGLWGLGHVENMSWVGCGI